MVFPPFPPEIHSFRKASIWETRFAQAMDLFRVMSRGQLDKFDDHLSHVVVKGNDFTLLKGAEIDLDSTPG